jgi:hypothetical protein
MKMGFLLLAVSLSALGTVHGAELTAKVTQLRGNVDLDGPGVPDPPRASRWQVIRAGVKASVPESGSMGVLCSTRRFVRLLGPVKWALNEEACAAGREVSPANYSLISSAPHFKLVSGFRILEHGVRGERDGDPLAPRVLSPRNTAIRTARPTVSWIGRPSAVQYRVEWSGRGVLYDDGLAAESVACAPNPEDTELCSLPWPADRPGLPAGQTFFLKVSGREGLTESWRDLGLYQVTTLEAAKAESVESRLRELEEFGLEGSDLATARSYLLTAEGLYGEAAESYRQILTTINPDIGAGTQREEIRLSFADLNAAMGLLDVAEPEYRQALDTEKAEVKAAASYGLGLVEYAGRRYREAAADLDRACELYSSQKREEEKNKACAALKEAQERLPRQ